MAELRAYNPSYRERIGNAIYDMLVGTGMPANRMRNEAQAVMDFVPGLGDVIGANDAARDYQAGDYVGAGVGGLATVLGMVPMVGDVAGKAVKKLNKADLDPFGFSKTKLDRPFDSIGVGIEETKANLPRKPLSVEELEGKIAIPLYGDRSAAGGNIVSINDTELMNPVFREGGPDYMVGPSAQADRTIWASGGGIPRRLVDRADQLRRETGRDVVGLTVAMGPDAVDFATFTGQALGEMLPSAKIKKSAAKSMDAFMRKKDPSWPGVQSEKIGEYLAKMPPETRKTFIREVEKAPYQSAGFPSVGAVRKAVTEPGLYDVPSGAAGFAAGQFDEGGLLLNPSVPHSTYDKAITGEYLGQMPLMHQSQIWRDAYKAMEGKMAGDLPFNEAHRTYEMKTKLPGQLFDAQLVDSLSSYIEQRRRGLFD